MNTDISWYKKTHRMRWVFCYPCKHRAECARFQSGFAGIHDSAHTGNFLRKNACIESRNDAHPLRRTALLPPLPRKGCAEYYTRGYKIGLSGTVHNSVASDEENNVSTDTYYAGAITKYSVNNKECAKEAEKLTKVSFGGWHFRLNWCIIVSKRNRVYRAIATV